MKPLREIGALVLRTMTQFMNDDGMRSGAALAFYATLSLAPLLLLIVSLISLLATDAAFEAVLLEQVRVLTGERGARVSEQILADAPDLGESLLGMAGSLGLLLIGGSALFVNVQGTLNQIWNVQRRDTGVLRGLVRARLVAFLMMLVTGGVLLLSIALGAAAAWLAPLVREDLPIGAALIIVLELVTSFTILTVLCAATYRVLPDVEIAWRDVWIGAAVTSALFLAGRSAIGWYLSGAGVASRFGAAGSVVAFLVWLYYSAQIYLLGAEFTQVLAERRGVPIRPSRGAVRTERRTVDPDRAPADPG